jgi:N utilization substance protein B
MILSSEIANFANKIINTFDMINRVLIRIKIIQIVYAYYQNGSKNLDAAEKELLFSLSKAYDLYNYLLMLMVAVANYAQRKLDSRLNLDDVTKTKLTALVENKFIRQLEVNRQLVDYVSNQKRTWDNDSTLVRNLFDTIFTSDIFNEYLTEGVTTYEADRELWRKIYKNFIMVNEDIESLLEEQSLYWNDDKATVDTFILKTIKKFEEANGADQPLQPEFKDDEDREFAIRLFRRSILNGEEYRKMIEENTRNWEFDRLALMDIIIMQVAVAEMLSFPNIPLSVTLNEYVELAKNYSTHKSGSFVNGTLDGVVLMLQDQGKLLKKF